MPKHPLQKTPHTSIAPTDTSAALWKRLFAVIYDMLIVTAVSLLYGALVTLISATMLGNTTNDFQPNAQGFLVQAGWVLSIVCFYCFFWLRVGQTVAMKAWRLKLVRTDGKPLDVRTCVIRCIFGFLSLACFGIGYLWALLDRQKLTLHDRLTKTRVIQLSS